MFENQFEAIPEELCQELLWSYKNDVGEYNSRRPVKIQKLKRKKDYIYIYIW